MNSFVFVFFYVRILIRNDISVLLWGDFPGECHRSDLLTLMYKFSDIILPVNYRFSN